MGWANDNPAGGMDDNPDIDIMDRPLGLGRGTHHTTDIDLLASIDLQQALKSPGTKALKQQ